MNSPQKNRGIELSTPLGKDKLLLYRMTAHEELGRPFRISLDLLSSDNKIDLDKALGQSFTVKLDLPNGKPRFFNGIVSQFTHAGTQGEHARYHATLVPWIWFLTRTADCRIFQQMTAPEIIKEVFREHGFVSFGEKLSGTYTKREYCVQYRETDFDFVSRLMEQEGIYYYFIHTDSKHTLQLADDSSAHQATSGYEKVPYFPPENKNRRERDHIFEWSISQHVQSGSYVMDAYDFERPKADLLVKSMVKRKHAHSDLEMFDYSGEYSQTADGNSFAQHRIEERQAHYFRASGVANAMGLASGALFKLEDYPRDDQNREHLLVATTHSIQSNEFESGGSADWISHECSFVAIDAKQPFRSERLTPLPSVNGPQTAVVVGKKGQELWTDKYGRVKVQFHWDRYGKQDENSSCWVRVAQVWAGKSWGAIHIPRIGQEVIVEFLEGDPDRPIITGRVYNADEMPPYKLPDNQTQSGIKTRSVGKGNEKTFNELRFEDKKGEEHIYFHAEKDFERVVENNDTLKVGYDAKDKGDQSIEIFNNQKLIIGDQAASDGSQTLTIWKDQSETIKTGDQTLKIEKGKRTSTIKGDDALTIQSGSQTIKISQGKHVTEAAQSILLKVGQSSIKIEPAGITMKSVAIKIQGDASIDMKAPMTTCKADGTLTLKGGMTMIN